MNIWYKSAVMCFLQFTSNVTPRQQFTVNTSLHIWIIFTIISVIPLFFL